MDTVLLFTWLIGAFLILPVAIASTVKLPYTEGVKTIAITLVTLFWPLAIVWGCLMAWRCLLVGK